MKKVETIAELGQLLDMYCCHKSLTNNYMMRAQVEPLVLQGRMTYCCTQRNLALLVEQTTCRRVYYYLNAPDEPLLLEGGAFVVEILYRGERFPQAECNYWQNCGFTSHISREMYEAKYEDLALVEPSAEFVVRAVSSPEEVEYARKLFNSTFDSYTGDYIDESSVADLFEKRSVLIATVGGEPCAALHYELQSGRNYLSHIAVEPEARGCGIARLLVSEFVRLCRARNARYTLWVQTDNQPALELYNSLGFRSLNRYSFTMLKI